MIVTEEEAKTKWCPEARVTGGRNRLRPDENNPNLMCMASQCMAWRWHSPSLWEGPPDATKFADQSKWQGFCGKAGA